MSYRWRYEDRTGTPVAGPDHLFDTKDDAEAWFGAQWQDLLGAGVDQVVLLADESVVYGPMSLHPPG